MKKPTIIRIIFAVIIFSVVVLLEKLNDEVYFLIDINIFTPVYYIAGLIAMINIGADIKEYIDSKKIVSFLPTGLSVVLISWALYIHFYHEYKLNQPTLLEAHCACDSSKDLGEEHCYSIHLKKNGTYIISEVILMNEYLYYGSYNWKDSIITLDKSKIGNNIVAFPLFRQRININILF